MNAILLARIQFAISIGFHYIFPQTTLGLTLMIVLMESLYVIKGDEVWKRLSTLLTRFLAIAFTFGVATGIVMPLSFGMNWGNFSDFTASVFGTQLAIESMVAFTLEAAFLGVLLFARKRVSKRVYLLSAFLVFLGSHLSAFFIVSANSWMETPAGYVIRDGRIVLTNWLQATFNPSFPARILHTVTASWISGLAFVLAISAYMILKNKNRSDAGKLFRYAAVFSLVLAVLQPVLGHQQIMEVHKNQPVKDAAYEGIFKSRNGAPLIGFGIPDAANHRIIFPVGIPYGLSFLETFNPNSYVKGLDDFPENQWPPVNTVFTTFHLMVILAAIILAMMVFSVLLSRSKAKIPLEKRTFFLKLSMIAVAAPYLANELGWISAEIGRQPWTVYGLLLTKDAGTAGQTGGTNLFTFIVFCLIYVGLAFLFAKLISSELKNIGGRE